MIKYITLICNGLLLVSVASIFYVIRNSKNIPVKRKNNILLTTIVVNIIVVLLFIIIYFQL